MRVSAWILFAVALISVSCEKPPVPASPPEAPKAAVSRAVLSWNSRDLQAMAVRNAACGSMGISEIVKEAETLRQATGIQRRGNVLTVGKARFENKRGDEDGIGEETYTYLGVYGDSGLDAVLGQYYEGYSVALVDARNGAVGHFLDLPIASPDGRSFAAISASDYDEYGLEIVERTPTGWVRRLKYDGTTMQAPCALTWRSNEVLDLRARWPTGSYDAGFEWSPQVDDAWGPARLVKAGDSWRYEPPKR
jgi:hypothetical protein